MTGSRSSNDNDRHIVNSNADDSDDDVDEDEILEESPCGRWVKRREEVIMIIIKFISLPCSC